MGGWVREGVVSGWIAECVREGEGGRREGGREGVG